MRRAILAAVLVACGGTIDPVVDPVPTDDAGVSEAGDASTDVADAADASACPMLLWCGDQWLTCDATGHATCKNRVAVCEPDPAAPPCGDH